MTASACLEREQRAINRRNRRESSLLASSGSRHVPKATNSRMSKGMKAMLKLHAVQAAYAAAEEKRCALEEEQFGRLPDRDASAGTFEERQFGYLVGRGQEYYQTCTNITRDMFSIVISIALFDEDKMLFACSGICVSYGSTQFQLTRFATSACLVTAYNDNMNKDDMIDVRLPSNAITEGFLGPYDRDIAIVTTMGVPCVRSVELDLQAEALPASPGSRILAAGRGFTSASLMAMRGSICMDHPSRWISDDGQHITEAALGGPLISDDGRFLGMNLHNNECEANATYSFFISRELLYQSLKHFRILDPEEFDIRAYSLPSGVSTIVPSGFRKSINRLKSQGYPMPPPLVLKFNGELLDHFEEQFGELRAWKGYPSDVMPRRSVEFCVWKSLRKKVVSDISRRVVSVSSFDGYSRNFSCTSLFIKWHGSRGTRSVILTLASLVRSLRHVDNIDNDLRIEVFLPPKQRANGRLEFYNLNYSIAIVSVDKSFRCIRPEDIFNTVQRSSEKSVVAIGCEADEGLLMASRGEVKRRNKDSELDCRALKLSTCKIKKISIGGPLINFCGNLVSMNFYDGREETPFLPRSKVVDVLKKKIGLAIPSERGLNQPEEIQGGWKENGWPVPAAYWYHGVLEVDRWILPDLHGRILQ